MLKLLAFKIAGFQMLLDRVPPDNSNPPTPPAPPPKDPPADWQAEKAKLEAEIAALKNPKPKEADPDDLAKKAENERKKKEQEASDTKRLESAILFTTKAPEWLKTNEKLLPATVPGLFAQAEKENYSNHTEKANALKSAIVSEFFAVQSNHDLLTAAQKIQLDQFKALTKNEKESRVQDIYDSIFEPTFEALKRVRKAEQLAKGLGDPSSVDSAYEKKMIDVSTKHYLRGQK